MDNIPEMFASCVFNDDVMRERLPRNIYESLHNTIDEGRDLDLTVANIVAEEMKNWAVSKGATHYTHWFQPMTGFPAQKHEAFIKPDGQSRVIMDFSGKELIRGESDAS
ncbi:MAG: glutamine synthetase III, partial [Clostridia bacterium]|nr:glutamine synthetase III [Clostridia bacterium]